MKITRSSASANVVIFLFNFSVWKSHPHEQNMLIPWYWCTAHKYLELFSVYFVGKSVSMCLCVCVLCISFEHYLARLTYFPFFSSSILYYFLSVLVCRYCCFVSPAQNLPPFFSEKREHSAHGCIDAEETRQRKNNVELIIAWISAGWNNAGAKNYKNHHPSRHLLKIECVVYILSKFSTKSTDNIFYGALCIEITRIRISFRLCAYK